MPEIEKPAGTPVEATERDGDQTPEPLPLWEYLQTDRGHETASRVIAIVEDIKKLGLETTSKHLTLETYARYALVALTIAAAATLSWFGKIDSATGALFGTIVGYFLGKGKI